MGCALLSYKCGRNVTVLPVLMHVLLLVNVCGAWIYGPVLSLPSVQDPLPEHYRMGAVSVCVLAPQTQRARCNWLHTGTLRLDNILRWRLLQAPASRRISA